MDVCAKLRGMLKEKRIGHAGTLDPLATGVLPVFAGSATRGVEFAEKGSKVYLAGLRLGMTTDTQDITGEVLSVCDILPGREEVEEVLRRFTGDIWQIPPMFSAVKRDGKRLYELARAGKEVERAARPVTIYDLRLLEQTDESTYFLEIHCSKGTYVRTLCHDIGTALGCGGCMSSLRRTMAAGFSIEEAVTLEQVAERGAELLRPVDTFFREYPAYTLRQERQEFLCRNGNPLRIDLPEGLYRVYDRQGEFLCLSRAEEGRLVSVKNFFGG